MGLCRRVQRLQLKYLVCAVCCVGLLLLIYAQYIHNHLHVSHSQAVDRHVRQQHQLPARQDVKGKGLLAEETDPNPWYTQNQDKVKIVVVEEHHEVLKYWFEAAEAGIIPRTGNTLLHIDGHSDGAPPMYFEDYPLFRPPTSRAELTTLMQRNDAFILQAAMAGLIDRVIWVWPRWDAVNHDANHSIMQMHVGLAQVTLANQSDPETVFCICPVEVKGETSELVDCRYMNEDDMQGNISSYQGTQLKPASRCQTNTSSAWEDLSEDTAMLKLNTGQWFKDTKSVILDIDEDYFGCESGTDGLIREGGIPWPMLQDISNFVDTLFAIQSTAHERQMDQFLHDHIDLVISLCPMTRKKKSCDLKQLLAQAEANAQKLPKKIFRHWRSKSMIKQSLLMLNNKLVALTSKQLRLLQEVGFCGQTTVKSVTHDMGENHVRICHGVNVPNETVVNFHSPTVPETKQRMSRLKDILSSKNYPSPGLVTLCRSMRDGYTPKSQFLAIEQGIIETVKASRRGRYTVYYDGDLLGGVTGWPARHM